jgi:hypothetical protein
MEYCGCTTRNTIEAPELTKTALEILPGLRDDVRVIQQLTALIPRGNGKHVGATSH